MPMGGTTEYARSMSGVMLAVLILQTVMCALRMFLLLDIMGGFIMGIAIGLGWYAWKEHMHITFICYWGMMSLFNGAFDLVKLIDSAVKSPTPMFSANAGTMYNVASSVQLLIPLCVLPGCILAWRLYKDAMEGAASSESFASSRGFARERNCSKISPREQGFTTFGGQGQRLGAV